MHKENKINIERLKQAKWAFTTRRVCVSNTKSYRLDGWIPKPGDLMLARITELGQHQRIELHDGRKACLFPRDEIVITCGNRYATDQFEAVLQKDKLPTDMVAAGGIASNMICRHTRMKTPTKLSPIGALCNTDGDVMNVRDFALPSANHNLPITTIIVAGTGMNAGKTLTAASLVQGLSKQGYKVGAAKLTGTGAGGDPWLMKDAGAKAVYDFTDAGYASTYLLPIPEIEELSHKLINQLASENCEIAVLEIADGLQHFETSQLLSCALLRLRTHGVIFASYDAMGAIQGATWLEREGYKVLGLSGMLTASPLARQEVEKTLDISVFTPLELQTETIAEQIVFVSENMAQAI